MNTDTMRFILVSTLVSLLSLSCPDLLAQSPDSPSPVDNDSGDDEVSTLDLFDEDAELTENGWAQFYVAAGFAYLEADGYFAYRPPDGPDIPIIDFDRAGLDDTDSSYWLSLNWRAANSRWGAWFGAWQYDTVGSQVWESSIIIDDTEIPVGAEVTSDFDVSWYIIEATYSFYRSDSVDTGIGFGVHAVDLDTNIAATVYIGEIEQGTVSTGLDTLAPLPNVLGYLHWKFTPRWSLVSRVGWFGLDYDKYSGQMINAHFMFDYQLSQRWKLGLAYQFVDLELDVEKKDYTEVYDSQFSGPMFYAKFNF